MNKPRRKRKCAQNLRKQQRQQRVSEHAQTFEGHRTTPITTTFLATTKENKREKHCIVIDNMRYTV